MFLNDDVRIGLGVMTEYLPPRALLLILLLLRPFILRNKHHLQCQREAKSEAQRRSSSVS